MKINISQALSDYLSNSYHLLGEIYQWDFNLKDFPDNSYVKVGDNDYQKSRHLRNFIHQQIEDKSIQSSQFEKWYVHNWGGVKTNKQETLQNYINSSSSELINNNIKGIATWSKILAVRNPSQFTIYDARVALSLNSIQKKFDVIDPVEFPHLPSRNKTFVIPAQVKIKKSGFFCNKKSINFYKFYIDLLQTTVKNQKLYDIQDAEMILFANAKNLSGVWI
jgi:hypothetical protein